MNKKLSMSVGIILALFVFVLIPERVIAVEPRQENNICVVVFSSGEGMSEKMGVESSLVKLEEQQLALSKENFTAYSGVVPAHQPVFYEQGIQRPYGRSLESAIPSLLEELSIIGVILLYFLVKPFNWRKKRYNCCHETCCKQDTHYHTIVLSVPSIVIKR